MAWRRLEEVDPDDPRAWLFGVARRLLANERRARGRRTRLADKAERLAGSEAPERPEDVVVAHEERTTVLLALERLRATDRDLLVAIAWDEMSVGDAAALFGCSPGALSVRLHRAKKRLAKEFRKLDAQRATSGVERPLLDLIAEEEEAP